MARKRVIVALPLLLFAAVGVVLGHDHDGGHEHGGHAPSGAVHRCGHDEVVEPYHTELLANLSAVDAGAHLALQAPGNVQWKMGETEVVAEKAKLAPPGPQLRASATPVPAPLRIAVDYQLNEDILPDAEAHLRHRLVPQTVAALQGAIKVVRPVEGRLKLPRTCLTASGFAACATATPIANCGSLAMHRTEYFGDYKECGRNGQNCKYVRGGEGLPDADFVLYVTATNTPHCTRGLLAFAGYCVLDPESNRPLAGFANFCPNALIADEDAFPAQVETAIHETLHALVFSTSLFSRYIDKDGKPLGRSNVIKNSVEKGRSVRKIVTPTVVREVRAHFACDSLDGAEIENEGGPGIAGSHWESRLFQYEIMDGQAGNTMDFERHVLSNLTLALLKDSGWYEPNWGAGHTLPMGRHAGCGFLDNRCTDDSPEQQQYYCTESRDQCSWDRTAQGTCDMDYFLMDGCSYTRPYMNTVCTNESHLQPSAALWGQGYGPQSRCLEHDTGERFAHAGLGTIRPSDLGCYHMSCDIDGTSVYLKIFEHYVRCPAGQYLELKDLPGDGFLAGRIGPCPEPAKLCPSLQCPRGCSANGRCVDGLCECYQGFAGHDCSEDACTLESCPSPSYCDLTSRLCQGGEAEVSDDESREATQSPLDKGALEDGPPAWVQLESGEWVLAVTTGTSAPNSSSSRSESGAGSRTPASLAGIGGSSVSSKGPQLNTGLIVGIGLAVLSLGIAVSAFILWRAHVIRTRRREEYVAASASRRAREGHAGSPPPAAAPETKVHAHQHSCIATTPRSKKSSLDATSDDRRSSVPCSAASSGRSGDSPGSSSGRVPALYVAECPSAVPISPPREIIYYAAPPAASPRQQHHRSRAESPSSEVACSSGVFFLPTPPTTAVATSTNAHLQQHMPQQPAAALHVDTAAERPHAQYYHGYTHSLQTHAVDDSSPFALSCAGEQPGPGSFSVVPSHALGNFAAGDHLPNCTPRSGSSLYLSNASDTDEGDKPLPDGDPQPALPPLMCHRL